MQDDSCTEPAALVDHEITSDSSRSGLRKGDGVVNLEPGCAVLEIPRGQPVVAEVRLRGMPAPADSLRWMPPFCFAEEKSLITIRRVPQNPPEFILLAVRLAVNREATLP